MKKSNAGEGSDTTEGTMATAKMIEEHSTSPLYQLLNNPKQTYSAKFCQNVCKYINNTIAESNYPKDASRILFLLLVNASMNNADILLSAIVTPIEKVYLKLMTMTTFGIHEYIKMGETVAYLLR